MPSAMMFPPKSLIFVSLILLSFQLSAQHKTIARSNQQWIQYYGQAKMGEKWTLQADASGRWKDDLQSFSNYLVRAGALYKLTGDLRIGGGFANLGTYTAGELSRMEYRPYQEVSTKNTFEHFSINHRYRLEERFFQPIGGGENSFNFRIRYMVMVSIPLAKLGEKSSIVMNVGDELFINAGSQIENNVFDQNRFLISPTWVMGPEWSVSFTWSNQFAGTTTAGTYYHTQVAWLQIRHTLSISKSAKN